MLDLLSFNGIDHSASVEAAVQRWVMRLESLRPLGRCQVAIRIDSYLLGLGKRARVDLALTAHSGELAVTRTARFREESDLYFLISDAFRDAYRQLG